MLADFHILYNLPTSSQFNSRFDKFRLAQKPKMLSKINLNKKMYNISHNITKQAVYCSALTQGCDEFITGKSTVKKGML